MRHQKKKVTRAKQAGRKQSATRRWRAYLISSSVVFIALLMFGCSASRPPLVLTPIPNNDVLPVVTQPLSPGLKSITPKRFVSQPQAAVAPAAVPSPAKTYALAWDAKLFNKTLTLPHTNGQFRLLFDVETQPHLSAPWTLYVRTNFNRVAMPLDQPQQFFRVKDRWE